MSDTPPTTHAIDKLRPNGLARQMRVRVDPAERAAFDRAARLTGLTLSAWVRVTLREAAERRLGLAGDRPGWV